jgi:hypothetical protein
MPAGMYKVKIKAKDTAGKETQTDFTDFALFGASADWGFTATPGVNNTYVLNWNKYPRPGEFQKYVLGKGDQLPPPPPTTAHATSYDAAQMPQRGFQPIQIANVNTTTRIIPASLLANLTLSARSKRGNFLTKPLAPTVIQAQATTPTQSQPAPTTPAGVRAQQRYQ